MLKKKIKRNKKNTYNGKQIGFSKKIWGKNGIRN